MSKIRQRYDEEFRRNAVKLSYATTKTIKEFYEDLGIHPSLLYRWRKSTPKTVIKPRWLNSKISSDKCS